MEIIIIDKTSIYAVQLEENIRDKDSIIAAYTQTSGNSPNYDYPLTKHAENLYSIRTERYRCPKTGKILMLNDGPIDIAKWWAQAYPIIEIIAIKVLAESAFSFIKWIRGNLKASNANSEHIWLQTVLAEDSWNVSQLCDKLSMSKDQAKRMLQGFGYIWDRSKMLYVATEETENLRFKP